MNFIPKRIGRMLLLSAVFFSSLELSALNLFDIQRKDSHTGVTVEKVNENGIGILRIRFPKTTEKKSWGQLVFYFPRTLDLSGFKQVEMTVKSNQKLKVSMGVNTRKGNLWTDWMKGEAGSVPQTFAMEKKEMKGLEKADLTQATSVTLGFGLYAYDTTKGSLEVDITDALIVDSAERFLIPRPTAGTAIDGAYKKDWGFENVLYTWFPPEYIHLAGEDQSTSKIRKKPEAFSGDFSFMYDDEYLYFLGLIADETPGCGSHPEQPWANDSIELFLAGGVKLKQLEKKTPIGNHGFQIIFDCSNKGKPYLYRNGQKLDGEKNGIRYKMVSEHKEVNGKIVPGYVLEAAVPIKLFPSWKPEKGALLAYCINLNDSKGVQLRSSVKDTDPSGTILGFNKAYLEFQGKEEKEHFKFGKIASDILWPEIYKTGGKRIWDTSFAEMRRISETAERMYLNGFWAVQGNLKDSESPDPAKWSYAPVPSGIGWYSPVFREQNGKTVPGSYVSISDTGKNPFYWYERTVSIPKHWKNGTLRLFFREIDKEAAVFINGKDAGNVSMLHPFIDLTKHWKPNEKNRLNLHLFTQMNPGMPSGIMGDVYLEYSKHAPVIKEIWAQKADGITGNFYFQIKTENFPDGVILAEIINPAGKILWNGKTVPKRGASIFSGICADFPAWSIENPQICNLRVRVFSPNGELIEDKSQPFGFRTFETKNGKFLLNGKIVRLRTSTLYGTPNIYEPGKLEYLKKLGFNSIYMPGVRGDLDAIFSAYDRTGFLALAAIDRSLTDKQTEAEVRRLRNHPSMIGYLSDAFGQLDCNGFIHNPFMADDNYMPDSSIAKNIETFMEKRDAFFKSLDPERGYIAQATGNWKNFMSITHHYPANDLNLMDRMMYHRPWAERKNKKLPLYLYETSVYNLFNMDVTHPEDKFPVMQNRQKVLRLLVHEAASRYLGSRAFENWRENDKLQFRIGIRGFRLNGVDGFCPWIDDNSSQFLNAEVPEAIKDNRKLSWKYFSEPQENTLDHSWMRTNSWFFKLRAFANRPWPDEYGQGTLISKDNIFTEIYRNEMQPLFITIAGTQDHIFSQDHNFRAGETIRKQIAVVNDTPDKISVKGTIALLIDDQQTAIRNFNHETSQGEIDFIPFEFKLPDVKEKKQARLLLKAEGRTESFALTVFPSSSKVERIKKAAIGQKIGIVKRNPISLAEKAGVCGEIIDPAKNLPSGLDVLIIESGALSKEISEKIPSFLSNGGRVLVLEQTDSSPYAYTAEERRLEHLFISDPSHPVVKGLSDEDLSFWRGRAGSVSDEKHPSKAFRNSQSAALDTPHLTNRNIVAGFVLPLPSYGSIHPIASGGYDRSSAVILEARSGKGKILFCQADVSSRYGEDPASTLLADNLLEFILQIPEKQYSGVCYSGDENGKLFLKRLGVSVVSDSPIGVVGGGKIDWNSLKSCRTIVRLPDSAFLPEGVSTEKKYLTHKTYPYFWNGTYSQFTTLKGVSPGTDFPESAGNAFKGLTPNDFYLFENPLMDTFRFSMKNGDFRSRYGTAVQVARNGKNYILCSFSPALTDNGEELQKIYRIWSVIFNNLNLVNTQEVQFKIPQLDLSRNPWNFLTDPDGRGEENGFASGKFGKRVPRPIRTGIIWEDQGVMERNPNMDATPDSGYDGFAWYFTDFELSDIPKEPIYLHVGGVRDIWTFDQRKHRTTLYLNGKKQPEAVGVYNAHLGGRGARLWKLETANVLKKGKNRIAIRIYNSIGPGGIHKNPVRFEFEGKNNGILFPYEFIRSKYTNNFFWCW